MSLNVTQESINALKTLRSRVQELDTDLKTGAANLLTAYQDNKTGLGYHTAAIEALLTELNVDAGDNPPVKRLVKKLTLTADLIADHQSRNNYRRR